MKDLTKAEEQVMQVLWKIKKGFVNDIRIHFTNPKPAYNTVSTIIRILERKGYAGHNAYGKSHEYFPLISKKDYTSSFFKGIMKNYFSDSYQLLVSFLAKDKNLSIEEMEDIKRLMEEEIERQKLDDHE
jgi:BlaI family transcriptional regulator, penicillinase repressor